MIALILAAVLSADAAPSPGCKDDSMQTAQETGLKKLLALETLCPIEKIEIEARMCGVAFTARMKANGRSYVCQSPREAAPSCHPALVDAAPAK